MDSKKIKQLEKKYIMQTYGRFDIVADHGQGNYLYSKDGKKYLDFLGGIATCSVGHNNPYVTKAICDEAGKIINITNLFYTEPQVKLAEKLVKFFGGKGKCFFSNSGTEANEAALKLARKFTGKYEIVALKYGFHGRTFGSLAATWKAKFKKDFKPMLKGFKHVPYDDISALKHAITKNTGAVIIEPIQGEAGVVMPSKGYLKKLSQLCKQKKVLLILDEIQSGTGRTGKFFAHEHEGIKPDIVTLAKGLANGAPIGATIATDKVSAAFQKGNHGSTFGGNNLACAAALATINYIEDKKLMQNAKTTGDYFLKELKKIKSKNIKKVRGKGLMIAVELKKDCKDIVNKIIEKGLLCVCTNETSIRFLPPLTITKKDVDNAIKILKSVLEKSK